MNTDECGRTRQRFTAVRPVTYRQVGNILHGEYDGPPVIIPSRAASGLHPAIRKRPSLAAALAWAMLGTAGWIATGLLAWKAAAIGDRVIADDPFRFACSVVTFALLGTASSAIAGLTAAHVGKAFKARNRRHRT
ncbi:MAG TPA: hypothetical protein VMZ50_06925 [Phycisphaerae bacterium]|nr:hypothetical protein [Phycisphaerae bacterium]HUX16882.1 hypothetical protein [Phycisphaerae bacterium]